MSVTTNAFVVTVRSSIRLKYGFVFIVLRFDRKRIANRAKIFFSGAIWLKLFCLLGIFNAPNDLLILFYTKIHSLEVHQADQ